MACPRSDPLIRPQSSAKHEKGIRRRHQRTLRAADPQVKATDRTISRSPKRKSKAASARPFFTASRWTFPSCTADGQSRSRPILTPVVAPAPKVLSMPASARVGFVSFTGTLTEPVTTEPFAPLFNLTVAFCAVIHSPTLRSDANFSGVLAQSSSSPLLADWGKLLGS